MTAVLEKAKAILVNILLYISLLYFFYIVYRDNNSSLPTRVYIEAFSGLERMRPILRVIDAQQKLLRFLLHYE